MNTMVPGLRCISWSVRIALIALCVACCAMTAVVANSPGLHDETVGQTQEAAAGPESTPACRDQDGNILLDFEGLGNVQGVGSAYQGCGVFFSADALAIIDFDAGGTGNFANEPSPNTVLFFLDSNLARLDFPQGFTEGFSFYYTAINYSGFIKVYSEIGGGGDLLETLTLPITPYLGQGDPNGAFDNWQQIGISFEGVARSIDFGGTANQIGFDNVTLGAVLPAATQPTAFRFDPIGLQQSGLPFQVTLTAIDSYGNAVTSFDTRTQLTSFTGESVRTSDGEGIQWSSGSWTGDVIVDVPAFSQRIEATSGRISGVSNYFTVSGDQCATLVIGTVLTADYSIPPMVSVYRQPDGTLEIQQAATQTGPPLVYHYNLINIPPGVYTLKAEQNGQRTIPVDVRVGCGTMAGPTLSMLDITKPPLLMVPGMLGSTQRDASNWVWHPQLPQTIALSDEMEYLDPNLILFHPVGLQSFTQDFSSRYNVIQAPWDWRVSLAGSGNPDGTAWSKYLKTKIEYVKEAYGDPNLKVDIVAHSMGGVLARAYIQSDQFENDIGKLVLLGTPNAGSALTYYMAEGGEPKKADDEGCYFRDVHLSCLYDFYRNSTRYEFESVYPGLRFRDAADHAVVRFYKGYVPTIYELFPTFPFLLPPGHSAPQPARQTHNSFLANLNGTSAKTRLSMDPCIMSPCVHTRLLLGKDERTLNNIRVGDEQPTAATYPSGKPRLTTDDPKNGDGTVVAEQAEEPLGQLGITPQPKSYGQHAALLKSAKEDIWDFLTDGVQYPAAAPGGPDRDRGLANGTRLVIRVQGGVKVLVENSSGNGAGVDPLDATLRSEISGALVDVTKFGTTVVIVNATSDAYHLTVHGQLSDDFGIHVEYYESGLADPDVSRVQGVFSGGTIGVTIVLDQTAVPQVAIYGELSPPTGLVAESSKKATTRLTWVLSTASEVDGYRVYRRVEGEPRFSLLSVLGSQETSYSSTEPWIESGDGVSRVFAITAFDNETGTESLIHEVTTNWIETVARFSYAITDAATREVTFTDLTSGEPTSWSWDFDNDGSVDSTERNPVYMYPDPGEYEALLVASGPNGIDTASERLDLSNSTPTAVAGPDLDVECEGAGQATVDLDSTESSDPDGDLLSCSWASTTCVVAVPDSCVTRAICPLGVNTVTLVVNDGQVDSVPDDLLITVEDVTPPIVSASLEPVNQGQLMGSDRYKVGFFASDVCDGQVETAALLVFLCGDIRVYNDQEVIFRRSEDCKYQTSGDGLEITAPELILQVTATDGAGNTEVAEATAERVRVPL